MEELDVIDSERSVISSGGDIESLSLSQEPLIEENKNALLSQIEPKEATTLNNEIESPALEKYNSRALSRNAETYQLEKFEKHSLLIFNQKYINGRSPREGTEKDVEQLQKTFSKFGFEVEVENDLTYKGIIEKLEGFSERDFTDYGCVAVAVLTHGGEQGLIRAKDRPYNESEIIKHFKVDLRPTLITKPRIVIIQACRGKEDIRVGTVFAQRGPTKKDLDDKENEKPYTLPVESDMLVLHSSYIGKPSYRDELNGSWFVQALCCKINELASTHDLESIMTEVKRMVAIDLYDEEHNTTTNEMEINKQMPVITSTLIRKLYLRKHGELGMPVFSNPNISMDRSISIFPGFSKSSNCPCYLKHFVYLRDCMKYYLEIHPGDG